MAINVQVPVGQLPFSEPYIRGRNGDFAITALRIHHWGKDDPHGDGAVDVHGIGKRGEPIVGGFRCLRAEDIDALCTQWIQARGGLAIMPGDEGVTALVTISSCVVEGVLLSTDAPSLQRHGERYVGLEPLQSCYTLRAVELLPGSDQSRDDNPT